MNKQTETLPDPRYFDAKKILAILEDSGFKARLAGGCVRDRTLGLKPKDFDIATNAQPPEVSSLFKQKNMKVVPTGIDHGTVTVVTPSGAVEITTLRSDVETFGRAAKVSFEGATFESDAARRDFTMNAMFEDRAGQVYDFHGGLEDLKKQVIQFVGDPETRIKEDYLRILRLHRFWAKFGFEPTPQALKAAKEHQAGIDALSQERVTQEWMQTLAAAHLEGPLQHMAEIGLLDRLLPEISLPAELPFEKIAALDVPDVGVGRLLLLLLVAGASPASGRKLCQTLKLSNKDEQSIALGLRHALLPNQDEPPHVFMDFIDQLEPEGSTRTFESFYAPIWILVDGSNKNLQHCLFIEKTKSQLRKKKLPIDGNDLKTLGVKNGVRMGALLNELREQFRDEIWSEKSEGLARAKKLFTP